MLALPSLFLHFKPIHLHLQSLGLLTYALYHIINSLIILGIIRNFLNQIKTKLKRRQLQKNNHQQQYCHKIYKLFVIGEVFEGISHTFFTLLLSLFDFIMLRLYQLLRKHRIHLFMGLLKFTFAQSLRDYIVLVYQCFLGTFFLTCLDSTLVDQRFNVACIKHGLSYELLSPIRNNLSQEQTKCNQLQKIAQYKPTRISFESEKNTREQSWLQKHQRLEISEKQQVNFDLLLKHKNDLGITQEYIALVHSLTSIQSLVNHFKKAMQSQNLNKVHKQLTDSHNVSKSESVRIFGNLKEKKIRKYRKQFVKKMQYRHKSLQSDRHLTFQQQFLKIGCETASEIPFLQYFNFEGLEQ